MTWIQQTTSHTCLEGCANTSAKDPIQMQKYLGVVREAWDSTSSTAKILEDAVKLGFGPIRVCTTAGRSVTPPDPKSLPERPCDPGVRELIGSLLFLSPLHAFRHFLCRCTTCQICHTLVRVGSKGNQTHSRVLLHILLNGLSS